VFLGRITLRITRWPTSRVDPTSYTTSGDVNFGFRLADDYGVSIHLPAWARPEAAMVYPLSSYTPETKGKVMYPPAFDLANADR
jgi:hypothetical protein